MSTDRSVSNGDVAEETAMVDVFISYKQEEREAVRIIDAALRELKLDVWFDAALRPGQSFDKEILDVLSSAKAVVVCWTPAAVLSEWVRGEAKVASESGRLVPCRLALTELIPPFNVMHTADLASWAGQTDDPAWLGVLERIAKLTDRPGLPTYHATMKPGVPLDELRRWADENGADPLVDTVWARIATLQNENAASRLQREMTEARLAADHRRAQAQKSRQLIHERGLRDPVRERRRFLALAGSTIAMALFVVGAVVYFTDEQERVRVLSDNVTTTAEARTFLADNSWHPIAQSAREKFDRLDTAAWLIARTNGSIGALDGYIADAGGTPPGRFLAQAKAMRAAAVRVREVQNSLTRLRLYQGPINGAHDQPTASAIALFRYRYNLPVSGEIDDQLDAKLGEVLAWWTHPKLEDLRAQSLERTTEADYVRFAEKLGVDTATITAVLRVEAGTASAFDKSGRVRIMFERQRFSEYTGGRYDDSHPQISSRTWGGYAPAPEAEHDRLAEAYGLDPEAALKATAWGRVQIMGFLHARNGFQTVGEFVRLMAQSEASQFEAGVLGFIRTDQRLWDALKRHDWATFTRIFHGLGPDRVSYEQRLSAAYRGASAEITGRTQPGWTSGGPPKTTSP
jgi:hypothetical protein